MNRPATPYNVRLASAALASLRGRPSSTDIVSQHAEGRAGVRDAQGTSVRTQQADDSTGRFDSGAPQ